MLILAKDLKHRGVNITPYNNDPKEQVSVDLTVGDLYQKSGDIDWINIKDDITIHPGSCILLQTKEELNMPNNVFGLLSTKGRLGAKGVVVANTKLDPLFAGKLNIPVFNVGNKKVTLKKGSKYCSISFWPTEHPVKGLGTRSAINIEPRNGTKIGDFFSNNTPHFITGIFAVLAAVLAAIITIKTGT